MTHAKTIQMALTYKDMREAELARRLGIPLQTFQKQMKTDKFTREELENIAHIMGARFIPTSFAFPDGTVT